jgi:hypothetical protein
MSACRWCDAGENVVKYFKVFEADDARDATAKGLYGRAFT